MEEMTKADNSPVANTFAVYKAFEIISIAGYTIGGIIVAIVIGLIKKLKGDVKKCLNRIRT